MNNNEQQIIEQREQLATAWGNIYSTAEQTIEWVDNVRGDVDKVNNEADSLIMDLRRLRNSAKKLGDVALKPMTVGFFGLSQAGKSFLISALAADEKGNLEASFDGKTLDFIKHINPPGGGKEATGLVTRFSRIAKGGIAGYPIELRIFNELDIAKILLNSFFNDFDKEKFVYELEQENISLLLKSAQQLAQPALVSGVSIDEMVDLQDYAMENFGKSLQKLEGRYWRDAINLVPYLSIENRAKLLSVLWGEIPELTAVYIRLAKTIVALGCVESVYAPISTLVKPSTTGSFSQEDSIMNVDMLERLDTERDLQTMVVPCLNRTGKETLPEVQISLAELAMLTTELIIPLTNTTKVNALEQVDLLDFPGYRGRLALTSIADIAKQTQENTCDSTSKNPICQLLLRGKVAYLFERYTDSQEMNILIVCTPSDKQSDVNSVGPVLERWIYKTQGTTAKERSGKAPGLIWAITMFDKRLSANLNTTSENLQISWGSGGLLQQTILERFGNYSWFQNWANGQAFNNVFLVRKPGFKAGFLEVNQEGQEISLLANEQPQLELMRTTFIGNDDIQKYIDNPTETWDAMLKLNDGGMERISHYLQQIAKPEIKLNRIYQQLQQELDPLLDIRLGQWYQSGGSAELEKKRKLAQSILSLLQKRAMLLGLLMEKMLLPADIIRNIYNGSDDLLISNAATQIENNSIADDEWGFDGFDDLQLSTDNTSSSVTDKDPKVSSRITMCKFTQNIFSEWILHLMNLPKNNEILRFFNLESRDLATLVDEIKNGAFRLKLPELLNNVIQDNERSGIKKEQLIEKQVFSVYTIISDFIAWLGFDKIPEKERPYQYQSQETKIFTPYKCEYENNIPKLTETTSNFTVSYLKDWFKAFEKLCEENASFDDGSGLNLDQNHTLGLLINSFKNSYKIENK